MLKYVSQRLFYTVLLLLLVSLSVYFIFDLLPVDPARLVCSKNCSPALLRDTRHKLGLDVSVIEQWLRFLQGLFIGRDYGVAAAAIHCPAPAFGYSFSRHECVSTVLSHAFPVTLSLAVLAFILWMTVGVSLGVLAARKKGSIFDRVSTVFVLIGTSLPTFLTGVLVVIFIILKFNLVDPLEIGNWSNPLTDPIGWLQTFIWPAATLAFAYAATYTRFTRSNVIETSSEDFIRTARAKGLSEKVILRKHTLRAALAPLVTLAGLDFAGLLGGAIITEKVFGLDGLGGISIEAVTSSYDLPIIVGTTIVASTFVVVANLIVDITYAFIDPRVRHA